MTPVDAILARLLALHPKLIDLSLDRDVAHARRARPSRAQAAAGDPCRRHQRQGLDHRLHARDPGGRRQRVHVYTSPHLVRFNERFRLGAPGGGKLVTDDELADALDECERANAGEPITVFEITTAAAFLLFSRHPADVLLLEVGLGGRLDATNVIEQPLATVITPVSLRSRRISRRHASRQIAAEKAGILKRGVPAVDRAAAARGAGR